MEILQDTIIQTQYRQGTETERLSVLFKSGEPAYSVDFKRLYIGDGSTYGGNLVGNLYKGESTYVYNGSTDVISGDLRFDNSNSTLYVYKGSVATSLSSWKPVANLTTPIYAKFNGLSGGSLEYSQQVTVSNLSTGHYKMIFPAIGTLNYVPIAQIEGLDVPNCQARTINRTLTSCDVVVLSTNGLKTDANVYFTIQY